MEVTFCQAVVITAYTILQFFLHLQSAVNDKCPTRLNECGIVAEAFQISIFGAVDIEMVGVSGSNDRHPWTQPMERTVELIGLDNNIIAIRENVVGAIVLGDTT